MTYNEAQSYNENPLPVYSMSFSMPVGDGTVLVVLSIPDYSVVGPGIPMGTTATEEQLDTAMQSLLDYLADSPELTVNGVQKTWAVEWHQEGTPTP